MATRKALGAALGKLLGDELAPDVFAWDAARRVLLRRHGEVELVIDPGVLPRHGRVAAEPAFFVRHDRLDAFLGRESWPIIGQSLVNLDRRCRRPCSHPHGSTGWDLPSLAMLPNVARAMAPQLRAFGIPWLEARADPRALLTELEAWELGYGAHRILATLVLRSFLDGTKGLRAHATRIRKLAAPDLTETELRELDAGIDRLLPS